MRQRHKERERRCAAPSCVQLSQKLWFISLVIRSCDAALLAVTQCFPFPFLWLQQTRGD